MILHSILVRNDARDGWGSERGETGKKAIVCGKKKKVKKQNLGRKPSGRVG